MLRILHLTDLHLSSISNDQVFDDYKSDLVPPDERNTRTSILRNTLKELGRKLRREKMTLDALVVTGDITVANAEDGFKQFDKLLSQLGGSCPPPEQIVVIPGNHDVTWYTPPSTKKRYENFLRFVRAKGYVTPHLDGIDIDHEGNSSNAEVSTLKHHLGGIAQGWLVLPINSSNYCGSLESVGIEEEDWNKIPDLLGRGDNESLRRSLRRARLHDVARISPGQFRAMRDLLQSLEQSLDGGGDAPLRIALLHHQLLPVSTREEFKSYESITNLGLLRHFLNSNGIHVVLHGHKHVSHTYWDQLYQGHQFAASPHRVLVISGSTIGGLDYSKDEVCRLLEFRTQKEAPSVKIFQVPAVEPGIKLDDHLRSSVVRLWADDQPQDPGHAEVTLVNGKTASEVYSRLLALFETFRPEKLAFNVVCQIADPTGATQLPSEYPADLFGEHEQSQGAFDEMVEWWQKSQSELKSGLVFTHGSRLASHEQLRKVISVLRHSKESGRAVATLLQPEIDAIDQRTRKFPAFCLAQFLITGGSDGQALQLSCIGYFRKQEVRYWWPVNIAELARLQQRIFEEVKSDQPGLGIGPITTIAAVALCSKTPPRVAIPLIDRLLDMKKDELWKKIYSIVREHGDEASLRDVRVYWDRILDDLVPAREPASDGSPVAIDGLDYVATHLQRYSQFHGALLRNLAKAFRALHKINERYAKDMMRELPTREEHQQWREEVQQAIAEIRTLLGEILIRPSGA